MIVASWRLKFTYPAAVTAVEEAAAGHPPFALRRTGRLETCFAPHSSSLLPLQHTRLNSWTVLRHIASHVLIAGNQLAIRFHWDLGTGSTPALSVSGAHFRLAGMYLPAGIHSHAASSAKYRTWNRVNTGGGSPSGNSPAGSSILPQEITLSPKKTSRKTKEVQFNVMITRPGFIRQTVKIVIGIIDLRSPLRSNFRHCRTATGIKP